MTVNSKSLTLSFTWALTNSWFVARYWTNTKPSMPSLHWTALPTWEGLCKRVSLLHCQFSCFAGGVHVMILATIKYVTDYCTSRFRNCSAESQCQTRASQRPRSAPFCPNGWRWILIARCISRHLRTPRKRKNYITKYPTICAYVRRSARGSKQYVALPHPSLSFRRRLPVSCEAAMASVYLTLS